MLLSNHKLQDIEYKTVITNIRYGHSAEEAYKIKEKIFPNYELEIDGVHYSLNSIIVHQGETVNSGHYYTLLCDPFDPSKFYKMNDEHISAVPRLAHCGDGYIFVYTRAYKMSHVPPAPSVEEDYPIQ